MRRISNQRGTVKSMLSISFNPFFYFIAQSKDEGVSAGLVDMLGWDSEESPVETVETKRKSIHFSRRRTHL